MPWLHVVSWFSGGALLGNAVHTVSGLLGHAFRSPLARPCDEGSSSSRANVPRDSFNLARGHGLLERVGRFDPHATPCMPAAGAGALPTGLGPARRFGRFDGGNTPERA